MHFILTPIYFVLHVWAVNVGEVDPPFTVIPLVVLVLASIVLRYLVGLILDKYSANILITVFWWLFFTYGTVYSGLKEAIFSWYPKLEFQGGVASDLPFILLVLELGIISVFLRLLRSRGKFPDKWSRTGAIVNSFLNGMTTFLVAMVLFTILSEMYKSHAESGSVFANKLNDGNESSRIATLPNIYHIVVDGYGRQDVLLKYLGFDNSSFINFLGSNGFAVLSDSWSNYSITQASLTSTLNLDYFENILKRFGDTRAADSAVTRGFATNAIRNNRLVSELKLTGYHYLHIGSIWEATIRNPNADFEYGCSRFNLHNEFTRALVARSWLGPFEHIGGASIARCHQRMFANLAEILRVHKHQPYYVFAHVLLPHYPYVFNDDCSVKAQVEMSNAFSLRKELWNDAPSYLAQLKCVNLMLHDALNVIKAKDPGSWIVIHSDHGPDIPRLAGMSRISARMANFIAVHPPGGVQFDVDFHSPLALWRKILGSITNTSEATAERFFYIPDDESGSIKSWKEFTIEELENGISSTS